ncbi:MAG: serine/threonine protein kinase [Myxococcales bacterium]|nr:serine/threonine protein kinase [Myxococcales bacterium]
MSEPTTLGRYAIERTLGEGGMGRVYLARDSVLGRLVAVKIVRPGLDLEPDILASLADRMRNEARAAATVSHPAIVTLHDMGVDDALGVYLVFEYVDAESLRARITRTGALSLHEIPALARELGAALTLAHEAGVIHRDVKPENVLLSRHGPKLADFGVARIPESKLTQRGTVLGTPAYSAPEALVHGAFSPASDQFSLAATLYEAISGRRAFEGEDAVAIAEAVDRASPAPLDPATATPRIVEALDRALARGMHKQPQDRFRSCAELAEAVAKAIEAPTSVDTPAPASTRAPVAPSADAAPTAAPRPRTLTAPELPTTPPAPPPPPPSARSPMSRDLSQRITLTPQEDDRPSVIIRARTKRWQNIVAGAAVIVIIALTIFGRDRHHDTLADPTLDAGAPAARATARGNGKRPLERTTVDARAPSDPVDAAAGPTDAR